MAFKQKSGSPFLRNFGVGKSPVKQTSPMKDGDSFTYDSKGNATHEGRTYKKGSDELAAHEEKHTIENMTDDKASTVEEAENLPLKMKSSGFKMKSSPFNRNFGVGDTPMKKLGKYIDGELVDDATYKDFVMKNKELEDESSSWISGGSSLVDEQNKFKEHFGDEFMTKDEWIAENYPGFYYDKREESWHKKGTHEPLQNLADSDYNEYFQDKQDTYISDKKTESNVHKYGTDDDDEISELDEVANYGQQGGITESSRVTLTGQDLVSDYQRQYQTFKKQNPKAGVTFSDFLTKNDLMESYKEAQSFKRSGEEDPETLGEYNQNRDAMNQ
jgi:hypothetical protein